MYILLETRRPDVYSLVIAHVKAIIILRAVTEIAELTIEKIGKNSGHLNFAEKFLRLQAYSCFFEHCLLDFDAARWDRSHGAHTRQQLMVCAFLGKD